MTTIFFLRACEIPLSSRGLAWQGLPNTNFISLSESQQQEQKRDTKIQANYARPFQK